MIINSTFKPAWWLSNPHLQTIWPVFTRRQFQMAIRRERIELSDGDFLDLDWVGGTQGPIIIVLHGLGGSINSPYAQGILTQIAQAGWRGVLMHFRGCSGEPNRLARFYHSGETGDLDYIVNLLQQREPQTQLAAIGYSLGGSVLLKWLFETRQRNPLDCAVAVSVPFDLAKSANHMSVGVSRLYQWWLLSQLRENVRTKFSDRAAPFDLNDIDKCRDFWTFDDVITAPLHGFRDAKDYYKHSSARQYLGDIKTKTLIVHSIDDPFMSRDTIPLANELSASTILELCNGGGHVGFISGNIPSEGNYWLDQRIIGFLQGFYK